MKKKIRSILIRLILFPMSALCQQDMIHIVTDQAYWYPFTYSADGQAKGVHIDIVQAALSNLNYTARFYPRPWKRCLQDAKEGKYDAVVSASFKPERVQYLIFPDDAVLQKKSIWRITQVEYVVITSLEESYTFNGDFKTLPAPVRVPLGYSISDDIQSAGVSVTEFIDPVDCARLLVDTRKGSFVTPPENAIGLQMDSRFKGKLKINPQPLKSKSYFMAFARKNRKLDQEKILAIWNEIARLREDEAFIKKTFERYKGQK